MGCKLGIFKESKGSGLKVSKGIYPSSGSVAQQCRRKRPSQEAMTLQSQVSESKKREKMFGKEIKNREGFAGNRNMVPKYSMEDLGS